jgi:hypothetical protein
MSTSNSHLASVSSNAYLFWEARQLMVNGGKVFTKNPANRGTGGRRGQWQG